MSDFVYINTIHDFKRDVDALKSAYDDKDFLYKEISNLTSIKFNSELFNGKKVLLKPNWVRHNGKPEDAICLITHFNFLIALLRVVVDLRPAKITIGDAPIQGCKWDKLIPASFIQEVHEISSKSGIPVYIKDFRRVKFDTDKNIVENDLLAIDEFIIFDLGTESYLEPITHREKNLFRVTQYDPDRFLESHSPGKHKYCITREIFDADIVISVPKLKTHQKAGITAAMKNIVGINGDKDFLPHHRIGGVEHGGDSYPGGSYIRRLAEYFFDLSYKHQGGSMYRFWTRMGSLTWMLSFPSSEHQLGAAWHGNDTVWRMVMDLNKIIYFGKEDGSIQTQKRRDFFSIGDGIIGGQGDGPLHPDPLALGVITFTNSSVWHDICVATLMGFDFHKIPLLKEGISMDRGEKIEILLDKQAIKVDDLRKIAVKTIPPPGWVKYFS
jgi:uncharacterized protein (DUF362 family)